MRGTMVCRNGRYILRPDNGIVLECDLSAGDGRNFKAREAQRIHCSVSSRRMEDEARDDGLGANILGMHLEGPYFAPTKKKKKRVLMIRVTSFRRRGEWRQF